MEIHYKPEWFEPGYYVYILIIKHKDNKTYYYIGMTGDRKHLAARSPFYRMMGHFNTYNRKSTDNQLIGGLLRHELIEKPSDEKKSRICVEEAIASKSIEIRAVFNKIENFDTTNHKEKRKLSESVEQNLINLFQINKLNIINLDINLSDNQKNDMVALEKAQKIFDPFKNI